MRSIVFLTLFFVMCSNSFTQIYTRGTDTLYIGKENITKIEIEKRNTLRHIKFTLDSNFVRFHKNEDITKKYLYVKFDFYPKNFFLKSCLESLLLPGMEAVILENKLDFNNSIYVRIGHYSYYSCNSEKYLIKNFKKTGKYKKHKIFRTYKNVASFKRSIKKNFPEEMIIEE